MKLTDQAPAHPHVGPPAPTEEALPPDSRGSAAQASLARLRSAARELDQELVSQADEHDRLRQELARAEEASRRHLARLAALEVELQTLKRAPPPSPDFVALVEQQDLFLSELLDDHERELEALRQERDNALAQLALRDHQARREPASSAELARLRIELSQARARAQEAEHARDVSLRAAARATEALTRAQEAHALASRQHPSPPPELVGALNIPKPIGRVRPSEPNRTTAPQAAVRLPGSAADKREATQRSTDASNRRTVPAVPSPPAEDLHLCGPDGDRLVPVEEDEPGPTLDVTADRATLDAATDLATTARPAGASSLTPGVTSIPTQPSLQLRPAAAAAPPAAAAPAAAAPTQAERRGVGSYSMPADAAAPIEVVPLRRNR